jgi:hypothetical protein
MITGSAAAHSAFSDAFQSFVATYVATAAPRKLLAYEASIALFSAVSFIFRLLYPMTTTLNAFDEGAEEKVIVTVFASVLIVSAITVS